MFLYIACSLWVALRVSKIPKAPVGCEEQVSDVKCTRPFLSCEGAGTQTYAPCMCTGYVLYRALVLCCAWVGWILQFLCAYMFRESIAVKPPGISVRCALHCLLYYFRVGGSLCTSQLAICYCILHFGC